MSVENQLQSAKENAEHFKALSLSNEAALAEVNSASKELQQDMEGKLKEVCTVCVWCVCISCVCGGGCRCVVRLQVHVRESLVLVF